MKAREIREMSDGEIQQRVQEAYQELFNLRFKLATNQLTNTNEIKGVRQNLARMKTVLRERQIWAEYESRVTNV